MEDIFMVYNDTNKILSVRINDAKLFDCLKNHHLAYNLVNQIGVSFLQNTTIISSVVIKSTLDNKFYDWDNIQENCLKQLYELLEQEKNVYIWLYYTKIFPNESYKK